MFTFGNYVSLAGFALDGLKDAESYNADVLTAIRQNQKVINDRNTRLETLSRNQQLIGQELALEMKAFGFDKHIISRQTRAAKATALAKAASSGSLDSQSLNLQINNIARFGAEARRVRSFNYGVRARRLGVEAEGLLRSTIAANKSANFLEMPTRTGLNLSQLGIIQSAVKDLGFKTDPKTGKQTPSFGTG